MLKDPFIIHKNKNPRNNNIENLDKIICEVAYEEITEAEKKRISEKSITTKDNIIKEDRWSLINNNRRNKKFNAE